MTPDRKTQLTLSYRHFVNLIFYTQGAIFFWGGLRPFAEVMFLCQTAVYLRLALLLLLHANIACHAWSVKMLTQTIRLPLPSDSVASARCDADF